MPYSIISTWVLMVAKALEERGLDAQRLFCDAGLDIASLSNPGDRFSMRAMQKVWAAAERATGDPLLGLSVADHWHPTSMHALGYSWMASETLLDAVGRAIRYGRMLSDAVQFSYEKKPRASWFRVAIKLQNPEPIAWDAALCVMLRMCQDLYGSKFLPRAAQTVRMPPQSLTEFDERFGCKVQFGAPATGILIDNAIFEEALKTANPQLVRANDQIIVDYLSAHDQTDYAHRVRRKLLQHLPSGRVNQGFIADQLHVSVRTLQRRLGEEGTSFQYVLTQARRELASNYLRDDRVSISEVAYLLGYSDSSNFTKAFSRWHGESPRAWRDRLAS